MSAAIIQNHALTPIVQNLTLGAIIWNLVSLTLTVASVTLGAALGGAPNQATPLHPPPLLHLEQFLISRLSHLLRDIDAPRPRS